jgi:hypothetical protein
VAGNPITEKFDSILMIDGSEFKGEINARYNDQGFLTAADFVVTDEGNDEWEHEVPVNAILLLSRLLT